MFNINTPGQFEKFGFYSYFEDYVRELKVLGYYSAILFHA